MFQTFDRFNLYWNGSLLFQFFPVSSFSFIGWYMQIYKILLIQKTVETSLKNKLPFSLRERKLDKQPERRLFFFIFR